MLTTNPRLCYAQAHKGRYMAKKTKKEKVKADARREQTSAPLPQIIMPDPKHTSGPSPWYHYQLQQTIHTHHKQSDSMKQQPKIIALRHDFIKTMFLSIIAIGIELTLYHMNIWK